MRAERPIRLLYSTSPIEHLPTIPRKRAPHYTRFAGYEGVPEGTIHFAGDHTSLNFQGYMEGAVRSGRRAARDIG